MHHVLKDGISCGIGTGRGRWRAVCSSEQATREWKTSETVVHPQDVVRKRFYQVGRQGAGHHVQRHTHLTTHSYSTSYPSLPAQRFRSRHCILCWFRSPHQSSDGGAGGGSHTNWTTPTRSPLGTGGEVQRSHDYFPCTSFCWSTHYL